MGGSGDLQAGRGTWPSPLPCPPGSLPQGHTPWTPDGRAHTYGLALAGPLSLCTDAFRNSPFLHAIAHCIHTRLSLTHTKVSSYRQVLTASRISLFFSHVHTHGHADSHRRGYSGITRSQLTRLPGDAQTHMIPGMHLGGHRHAQTYTAEARTVGWVVMNSGASPAS